MRHFLYKIIAAILFLILLPLFAVLYILVKLSSRGPFIFRQNRVGERGKIFTIYKIRTMIEDADELKPKYQHLNEAASPAFKINSDPRFTAIGKSISRFGLDELPQLINIIKGDMSFVGPRPLPINESALIPAKYRERFNILPGITSLWAISGMHKLSLNSWMETDLKYNSKQALWTDFKIIAKTILLIIKQNCPQDTQPILK